MKYVSSFAQLNELVALGAREPILIGGEIVFISHERSDSQSEAIAERFIAQSPRTASRKSLFDKTKQYLYLSIDKKAIELLASYKGDVAFAADQYLAYGSLKSAESDVIIIGGGQGETEDSLSIEGLVFTNQQLTSTFERSIQNAHGYILDLSLTDIATTYPDHKMLWCAPLPEPPTSDITKRRQFSNVGDEPLKNIVKRKIYTKKQSESEGWGIIPAVAVSLLGFIVFAGAYAYQWAGLEAEKSEYRHAITGYEDEYANSAHSLELLRHRDFALTEESQSVTRIRLLNLLISHTAAVKDVRVHKVSVYDPQKQETSQAGAGIFLVDMAVPKKTTAREQARPIVDAFSALTGMTVQVIAHNDETVDSKEYWRYQIGGEL